MTFPLHFSKYAFVLLSKLFHFFFFFETMHFAEVRQTCAYVYAQLCRLGLIRTLVSNLTYATLEGLTNRTTGS